MIWPFPDGTPKDEDTPRFRNGVLVGLAEAVVVVQASLISGSRNAATWARDLDRRLFLVPGMPWDHAYEGTMIEGASGDAEPAWSIEHVFAKLGLPAPDLSDPSAEACGYTPRATRLRPPKRRTQRFSAAPLLPLDLAGWSKEEKLVFSALSFAPTQQDTVIERVGLPTSSTLTALLTLSLKDVVVEGPDGFFRRRLAI
jgi:DNA processing protein